MVKTPDQWLEEAAPQKKQAIFKLFLGYAPGVGKTFNMLSEGIRRHSRGEDVVIGVVETHGRAGIAELASKLETVPRRKVEYGTGLVVSAAGHVLTEADVAIKSPSDGLAPYHLPSVLGKALRRDLAEDDSIAFDHQFSRFEDEKHAPLPALNEENFAGG